MAPSRAPETLRSSRGCTIAGRTTMQPGWRPPERARSPRSRTGRRRPAAAWCSCSTPRAALERRLLGTGSSARARPARRRDEAVAIPPSRRRRRGGASTRASRRCSPRATIRCWRRCASPGARRERDGEREARLSDLLTLGDPRDPGRAAPALDRARAPRPLPDRRRRAGARLGAARALARGRRQPTPARRTGLAEFVARQAALALERAERRLRGARYKVPRFVHEDILARPAFRGGVARARARAGAGPRAHVAARGARATCARSPRPTARTSSTSSRRSDPRALHARLRRALHYDRAQLDRSAPLAQRHPLVFLPIAQVEPRPPRPAVRAPRERPPAEPHRRRHQHELLPGRPAGAAQRRLLHPPHLQGQRGLQVRAAPVHRLPDREALPARVVHRGRPLALGQAAAAALRAARLRRRRLPARQERGRAAPSRSRSPTTRSRTSATTSPSSAAPRRSARASAGSCASCAGSAAATATSTSASASRSRSRRRSGPPDPARRAGRRRGEPRAPEARLRGLRSASTG